MASYTAPIVALTSTILAGLLLCHNAERWGLVDRPGFRKVHSQITPRTGGMAMVIGCLMALLLAPLVHIETGLHLPWQTWTAGGLFIGLGALDDRLSFQPRRKFLVLFAISALAAWPWLVHLAQPSFPGISIGPWSFKPYLLIAFPVLTFWFMAVPNAVNIDDAINGYMGGFTLILMLAMAVRGLNTWIPIAALLGFLVLNWPKAKHFLGDAGSFGCGFLIAEVLLRGGGLARPMDALILTAPISMDVAIGIIRRKCLKMSIFQPDQQTCPHHMLTEFKGSALLASGVLWVNAILFAFLAYYPAWAGIYALGYGSLLVFLNRQPLGLGRNYT